MTPRRGDRYRSKRDVPVGGIVTFRNPSSGGFRATLSGGEIVTVKSDPPPGAKGVYVRPERYEALEQLFVPAPDFESEAYDSYALVISFEQLTQDFEKVG